MILCDSDCFVRFTDVIFHVYSESSWPLYFVIPGDTSSIIVRIIEFHGLDICLFAQCDLRIQCDLKVQVDQRVQRDQKV